MNFDLINRVQPILVECCNEVDQQSNIKYITNSMATSPRIFAIRFTRKICRENGITENSTDQEIKTAIDGILSMMGGNT